MKRFRNSQYLINEDGLIYNEKTKRYLNPCLKTFKKGNQYYIVTLHIENKQKTFLHHRILAEVFIENPNKLPQINHKDGNGLNNKLNNLEWCNQKHNNIHAIETGLRPTKINREIAENIRKEIENNNIEELSIKYNISISHIKKILRYERWN